MKKGIDAAILAFSLLFLFIISGSTALADTQYKALGDVQWYRNLNKALEVSKERDLPVFVLFQEIPGCSTCVNYGTNVLSHPLVAEAIETLFVPLAVFNNRGGDDAEALKAFNEPKWNNPVVRIIDYRRNELTKRLAGDYSIAGTTGAMISALQRLHRPVPEYLRIVNKENSSILGFNKAVLSMWCFWEGEIELGKIEGVVATRSGYMQGREVVEVHYNPSVLSYRDLLRKADRIRCADKVFYNNEKQANIARSIFGKERVARASSFHPDNEIKYYMSKTSYRYLPVTSMQAMLINRAVYEHANPDVYLSQWQLKLLGYIKKHPGRDWKNRINDPNFTSSWNDALEGIGSF
jgi:hypothetical protein